MFRVGFEPDSYARTKEILNEYGEYASNDMRWKSHIEHVDFFVFYLAMPPQTYLITSHIEFRLTMLPYTYVENEKNSVYVGYPDHFNIFYKSACSYLMRQSRVIKGLSDVDPPK